MSREDQDSDNFDFPSPSDATPPAPAPAPVPMMTAEQILASLNATATIARDTVEALREVAASQEAATPPNSTLTTSTLKLEAPEQTEHRGQIIRDFDFDISNPGSATYTEPAEPSKQPESIFDQWTFEH